MNTIEASRPENAPIENIRQSDDPLVIEGYLTDESAMSGGHAEKVYFPTTEAELAAILRHARQTDTSVTISGGGTGLTGSRMPIGGIIASVEDMRMIEPELCNADSRHIERDRTGFCLNAEDRYALAPPGLLIQGFQEILDDFQLLYPPTPTEMTCMLGGTVATNASGGRGFHYGATREWIRRLRVILPNGDVIDLRRGQVRSEDGIFRIISSDGQSIEVPLPDYTAPDVKNAAGYYVAGDSTDLVDLFIGAEGTLGAFSLIEVSLTDLPEEIFSCIAFFRSMDQSVEFMREARRRSRSDEALIRALMLDYIDHTAFGLVREDHPNIPEDAGGAIYFEQVLEGGDEPIFAWAELIEEYGAIEDWSGFDDRERQMMKDMRHAIPERIHEIVRGRGLSKIATDLAVPEDDLDTMLASYRKIGEDSGLDYCFFGHIGDNHLHFNFLPETQEESKTGMKLALRLCRQAIDLGGTISAEHGCGKKAYVDEGRSIPLLELMYGEEGLRSCAKTKLALDPSGLLNRGNIVPEEYLK